MYNLTSNHVVPFTYKRNNNVRASNNSAFLLTCSCATVVVFVLFPPIEITVNLEYYGIFLSDREKAKLSNQHEVFEIDCQALFYFELERFSKAQAIFGANVLNYFECIQQDGAAFPREFYPDSRPIFNIDIIYNVFTEMQILTELFVLLATGIDLEIISVYAIPPQFRHSRLGDELKVIQDFLYNYYIRVFPQERSSAAVMRKLPELPIIYEPITAQDEPEPKLTETIETIIEESEEVIEPPAPKPRESPMRRATSSPSLDGQQSERKTPIILGGGLGPSHAASTGDVRRGSAPGPRRTSTTTTTTTKPKERRFSMIGRQKLKLIKAYKTISERRKERPSYATEGDEEEEEEAEEPELDLESEPNSARQVHFDSPSRRSSDRLSPQYEPQIRTKRKTTKRKISERPKQLPQTEAEQEALLDEMRRKYKAPVRRDNSARRRGRLFKEEVIQHNAFTYMVTRVIAFLQERGHLKEEELNNTKFIHVEKSFII